MDATFVAAPRQRNSREENEQIKAGETPANFEENPHKLCQKDVGARWTKKNGETHFGYKNHIRCDRKSKLITAYSVTDASVHDSQELDSLLARGSATGQTLHADSAYRSAAIETKLARRSINSRIHEKGYRGKPLTKRQMESNTCKSRIRARVEHVFGFMTQSMGGLKVRCCSLRRNEAVIGLMNLTYNLCRVMQLGKHLKMAVR